MTWQDTTTESTEEEPGSIEQYDSVDEDHVGNNDIAKPSMVYANQYVILKEVNYSTYISRHIIFTWLKCRSYFSLL